MEPTVTNEPYEIGVANTVTAVAQDARMGAWGSGNFENDTALDFRAEVDGADGPDLLLDRIAAVAELDEDEQLDADLGCELLVAAEYLAAALGKPARDFDADAEATRAAWKWRPTKDDVARCVVAASRNGPARSTTS